MECGAGGDEVEQRRFGDDLAKEARYARASEYLRVFRELWRGDRVDLEGEHVRVQGAQVIPHEAWPRVSLGGSSPGALEVGAAEADVFLAWGEPPAQVDEKLAAVRVRAQRLGRELKFGIRLHVITGDTSGEAWAERTFARAARAGGD
jgi:alkanesulfonate monooxygenase